VRGEDLGSHLVQLARLERDRLAVRADLEAHEALSRGLDELDEMTQVAHLRVRVGVGVGVGGGVGVGVGVRVRWRRWRTFSPLHVLSSWLDRCS
jgi:hypothetical protein